MRLHALLAPAWMAVGSALLFGCATAPPPPTAPSAVGPQKASAHALVLEAAACWMGGLWGDALGEQGTDRTDGIERRCTALLRDVDLTARERGRALADKVPPPAPEEAYYPLRAVEPDIVDAIAVEVEARAARQPGESASALVKLLRAVAAATRETVQARRVADVVKADTAGPTATTYAADKALAAAKLDARAGMDTLFQLEAGDLTAEARALGILTALDRIEIARGLPKHLKIEAVGAACADVFHVEAPTVSPLPATPLVSGIWLEYLTNVAAAAGHPVPADARDPQNREPLAWTGILEGFADRLRSSQPSTPEALVLADVERRTATRLDEEFQDERERYVAHALSDR